jgi:hypothetical protein
VGTEDGSQINSTEALGLEELVEVICWGVDVRETVANTCGSGVLAADKSCNNWSTWTADDGVGYVPC